MSGHPLPLTGERTLPGVPAENYWFRRHEIAYRECVAMARDRAWATVVDAGCGEGYGADLLADAARQVVAVDRDLPAIAHIRQAYPRLRPVCANLIRLPLPAGSCDAVVSLQVIEHQWDVDRYLAEVARVLRPGGTFLCATPNRLTFTPHSATPVNPFHTVEFAAGELASCLERRFAVETVGGVWHASRLTRHEAELDTSLPQLLADAGEPAVWPEWLADLVSAVTADDFLVAWPSRQATLDDSRDLLAVCRSRSP